MVKLIITLLCILWGSVAQATTYYVATTGSNANDGLSESTPKLTVKACVDLMFAGDTCYVRGGTYNTSETIRFSRTGTANAPIKLLAYPGERPIINFVGTSSTATHMLIIQGPSATSAMGYFTIEGFEIVNGWFSLRWVNLHNSFIRHNWFRGGVAQGVLGAAAHHVVFERNIISHTGNFAQCEAVGGTAPPCALQHGFYTYGDSITINHNLIYDSLSFGIQQNGSPNTVYNPSIHPSSAFAGSQNWIIADNTIAHNERKGAWVPWGTLTTNSRFENNIVFNNAIKQGGIPQGIEWVSASGTSGVQIRNNHFYADGSGGTVAIGPGVTEGVQYTQSGNVVNVSAPAFVASNTDTLPPSPDYRLTASAPVNIARVNEWPNNSTLVAGAFKTVANPTASITANVLTLNFPMSTAVPIQNLSTTGVTVGCTGSACPGSPTVSTVVRRTGTDSIVDVTISGITGNACEAANQNWTVSYNSAIGSWTGNDNIGPYPGLHQKIFSFTNLAATNNCDGTPPPPPPAGPYIKYALDEGTGTTATNSGSFGASGNGTLTGSVTWASGNGLVINGSSNQYVAIPYGSGVNPTTQNLTIAFEVDITPGFESLNKGYFGAPLGTNQRLYISSKGGAWAIGVQASNDAVASELSVSPGKNHLCLVVNAGTDTVTLHKNGVASTTAGGVKSITSYILSDDFELGNLPGNITSGGSGTFRHFVIYQSVEDCDELYQATQTPAPPIAGTFAQAAVQAQAVHLPELGGSPTNLVPLNAAKKVVVNGALAWVFQIHCQNIANCDQTSFRLAYRKNGTGSWQQVPNMPTVDGISMYGSTNNQYLNNGATTTRLTGSCAVTDGVTLLDANQVPPIDLPQDGCVMLRWIVQYTGTAGDYYEHRVETEGGGALSTYTALARVDLISQQAGY